MKHPHNETYLSLITERDGLKKMIAEYTLSLSTPQFFSYYALKAFRKTRTNLKKKLNVTERKIKTLLAASQTKQTF